MHRTPVTPAVTLPFGCPLPLPFACDNFLYGFKGALTRARPRAGRSGLDKGTLAAAHIGLVRAGQEAARSPDSLRAAAPCQVRCSVRARVPEPVVRAPENGETMTTRATAPAVNDGGTARAGGVGKGRALRAGALGARRADAWRPSPLPLGRWWLAVTRRSAPAPRVKQRFDGAAVQSACSGLP